MPATPQARRRIPTGAASVLAALLAVAGCAVGPDFRRPAPPAVGGFVAPPVAEESGPPAPDTAQLASGEAVPATWWELFHYPALDDVLRQAIADNETLVAARATLAAAQEAETEARGAFWPQIDLAGNLSHEEVGSRSTTVSGGRSGGFNLYSVGPTVSYVPDVFGATRRGVEQAAALAEKQRYELAAAYLTLTGNAVTQSMTIASARMQLAAAEDIVADDQQNENLVRQKLEAGKAAEVDVLTAESQLATDRAQIPPLRQQLSVARHALAILVGRFPADWSAPEFDLAAFALPGELPLSLPSEVARQRPDVLAAEAQLHADSAAIGVATAQLYPTITLSASVNAESLANNFAFPGANAVSDLAAGVTAPLFHGGALLAQRRGAIDTFQGTLATYRQTVLAAFQQVADTLRALEHDSELVDAERHALDTSDRARVLQRVSYEEGKSDLLQLLDAERVYQQARLGYARAQAQRLQDTTQLLVALGGGWWGSPVGSDASVVSSR